MDVGPHRDLAGDLARAVVDRGLKRGFYYAPYEWYDPLYPTMINLPEAYVFGLSGVE